MGLIIALTLLGILLTVAEILLIPGIFITGLLGLGSLTASCYFAFEHFGQGGGIAVTAVNLVLLLAALYLSMRSKTWDRISLKTAVDGSAAPDLPAGELIAGRQGTALSRLNPMGKARFGNLTVEVSAPCGFIDAGTPIEIIRTEDRKIYVKPL